MGREQEKPDFQTCLVYLVHWLESSEVDEIEEWSEGISQVGEGIHSFQKDLKGDLYAWYCHCTVIMTHVWWPIRSLALDIGILKSRGPRYCSIMHTNFFNHVH